MRYHHTSSSTTHTRDLRWATTIKPVHTVAVAVWAATPIHREFSKMPPLEAHDL